MTDNEKTQPFEDVCISYKSLVLFPLPSSFSGEYLLKKPWGMSLLFRIFRLVSYGFVWFPKFIWAHCHNHDPARGIREHQSLIPFLQRDLSYVARRKTPCVFNMC